MEKCYKKYHHFDYLENNMSVPEKLQFEAHLLYCNKCKQLIAELSKLEQWKKENECIKASPFFYEKLIARINLTQPTEKRIHSWQPVLVVAICMFVIIIGLIIGNYYSNLLLKNNLAGYLQVNELNQESIELSLLQ